MQKKKVIKLSCPPPKINVRPVLDLKGLKGLRVLKVFQDHKAFLDLKDLLVLKAYLGPSDLRVLRAFQGRQDRLGPWVQQELQELPGRQASHHCFCMQHGYANRRGCSRARRSRWSSDF